LEGEALGWLVFSGTGGTKPVIRHGSKIFWLGYCVMKMLCLSCGFGYLLHLSLCCLVSQVTMARRGQSLGNPDEGYRLTVFLAELGVPSRST
jgi:hypothetical protein